jgi:N6-L-threonylcarbamoyladenine synthase
LFSLNRNFRIFALFKQRKGRLHLGKTQIKIWFFARFALPLHLLMEKEVYILAIESSCDDTSAAVLRNEVLLSNVTASQAVHESYGGVVPELASRAHQQNIVPVVHEAIKRAGITKEQLSAVAFTRGPGLMGSLLVGVNFAKGFARSLGIPMIDVNHLQGHVMAHFIKSPQPPSEGEKCPPYPFLCLLVSGGNSQIVLVRAYNDMEVLGQTIDDAAGEAIDKCSKVMGLGYPGGPIIDRLARQGNPKAFQFAEPHIPGLDYSFSGLKTSFLYSLRKWIQDDPDFIEHHKEDIAASLEWTIVDILMKKLRLAVKQTGIKHVAVAGGVSANNGLRNAFHDHARRYGWTIYIPKFSYTTDNAAMIGVVGYYKYLDKEFCPIDAPAFSKVTFK